LILRCAQDGPERAFTAAIHFRSFYRRRAASSGVERAPIIVSPLPDLFDEIAEGLATLVEIGRGLREGGGSEEEEGEAWAYGRRF
jgi:hypothetical protein